MTLERFRTVYFSTLPIVIHGVTDRKFISFSITPVGDTPYRVSFIFASSANFNNWTFNSFEWDFILRSNPKFNKREFRDRADIIPSNPFQSLSGYIFLELAKTQDFHNIREWLPK